MSKKGLMENLVQAKENLFAWKIDHINITYLQNK